MKFNVYTITFYERLTEGQKEMVDSAIASAQKKIENDIDNRIDKISSIRKGWRGEIIKRLPTGENTLNSIEANRTLMKSNLTKYFYIEWPDVNICKIYYCNEKLKGLPVIDEGRIIDGLKRFIFPDMKLSNPPIIKKEEIGV